ncbi:hypothetical protein D3C77_615960 [compost metagenome]
MRWKRRWPQSSTRHQPFPLVNRAEPRPLFISRTFRVTEQGPGNEEGSVSDIRIGISGRRYGPWRKDFYPKDAPYDARCLLQKLSLDHELMTEPGVVPEVAL